MLALSACACVMLVFTRHEFLMLALVLASLVKTRLNVHYSQQKSKFYYFNVSVEKENPKIGNQIRFLSFAFRIDEFDKRANFLLNFLHFL